MKAQIDRLIELERVMAAKGAGYDSAVGRWILDRAKEIRRLITEIAVVHGEHHEDIEQHKARAEKAKALCDTLLATRWGRVGARLWWGKYLK